MKRIWIVAVSLIIILMVAGTVKDIMIKVAIEKGVQAVTGLRLTMSSIRVGILKTVIDINNLRIENPTAFKDRSMLIMPEIYIAYVLPDIMKNVIHISEARIDVKEFVVVKNERGQLNLNSLKFVQDQKGAARPAQATHGKAPAIRIDTLRLKIGKVIYRDYSLGAPVVKEFNVNIDETYADIDNPQALAGLIISKALMNTTIASLTNFDLGAIQNLASGPLSSAQNTIAAVAKEAQAVQAVAKQSATTVAETAQKTTEAVKDTASALKDVFGSAFGSGK